jgi:hypothetical protein
MEYAFFILVMMQPVTIFIAYKWGWDDSWIQNVCEYDEFEDYGD